MLAKKHRLNVGEKEFSIFFKKGSSLFASSDYFLAYFDFSSMISYQVACLTPKKVLPLAVSRNAWRRKMYVFFEKQLELSEWLRSSGIRLIIVLKKNFNADSLVLESDFARLIEKIGRKQVVES